MTAAPSSHVAALCVECGAAFVVASLPLPLEVAARRMMQAACPDCGSPANRLRLAAPKDHDRAVARLREEAARP